MLVVVVVVKLALARPEQVARAVAEQEQTVRLPVAQEPQIPAVAAVAAVQFLEPMETAVMADLEL